MLNILSLTGNLASVTKNIDFSEVTGAAKDALDKFSAAKKSVLGNTVGKVTGGIEELTQEIDDAKSALQANLTNGITRITSNVEGVAERLMGSVPSTVTSDIAALTGKTAAAADGFLKEIVSHASPEAIDAALKKTIGSSPSEIESTLKTIGDINVSDLISKAVGNSPFVDFLSSSSKLVSQLEETIGANSQLLLVDFGEKLEKNFESNVNKIFGKILPAVDVAAAFNLVAKGDYDNAFNIVSKYIDLPPNYYAIIDALPKKDWPADILEAFDRLSSSQGEFTTLKVELSSYINQFDPSTGEAGSNTLGVKGINGAPYPTAGPGNVPYGRDLDNIVYDFSDITSVEELESLFRSISRPPGREIAGAIIHWSATCLDQNVGAAEIHAMHIERGFNGCGYHILIRRDGTLQRGRPLNFQGAHDRNNNRYFIGFCFVGGINVTSRELANSGKTDWQLASSDSFTPEQWNSYDQLMKTFHAVFPYGQVAGHYETSTEGKIDPGFDVPGYSLSKYNHSNVIPEGDPLWKAGNAISLETIRAYSGQGIDRR